LHVEQEFLTQRDKEIKTQRVFFVSLCLRIKLFCGFRFVGSTAVSPQTFIASNPKSAYTAGNQKIYWDHRTAFPHFFATPLSKAKPTQQRSAK
jgi:hypothetical protein